MAGRVENLKPFKKGQSGNPKGRPPKKTLQELIERLAFERFDGDKTRAEAFVEKLWDDAIAGKESAVKIVLDRHDGPVKQKTEHSGSVEGLTINVFRGQRPEGEPDADA